MRNIFTCGCLADGFRMKTICEILTIFEDRVEFSDFIRINFNNDFYIFCPWITEFCYKANHWYFYKKTCSNTYGLCDCFHLLKFGFKTICNRCSSPLQKKLFPFLIKVK